jgi:hypothetical protein
MRLSFGEILFLIAGTLWLTLCFGGFAFLYWTGAINDPRNIFGDFLSNIGAALVFPLGWCVAVWNLWNKF